MKKFKFIIILLSGVFISETHAKYGEKCRQELNSTKPDGTYIYYTRSYGMSYPNEEKIWAAVDNLYEMAFSTELRGQHHTNPKEAKNTFCNREIEELEEIYKGTHPIKEWLIASTSKNCLERLKKGFCFMPLEEDWVEIGITDDVGRVIEKGIEHHVPNLSQSIPPLSQELPKYDNIINGLVKENDYKEMMNYRAYRSHPIWLIPTHLQVNFPESGWKMHLGLHKANPAIVTNVVLKLLRENKVYHKMLASEYAIELFNKHRTQRGKVIAIYPENEAKMIDIAKKIDERLARFSEAGYISPPFEAKIGSSGALTARYGVLRGDNSTRIEVVNQDGKSTGEYIPDSRDGKGWKKIYAPDFVTWNPFTDHNIMFQEPPLEGWD